MVPGLRVTACTVPLPPVPVPLPPATPEGLGATVEEEDTDEGDQGDEGQRGYACCWTGTVSRGRWCCASVTPPGVDAGALVPLARVTKVGRFEGIDAVLTRFAHVSTIPV